MNRHAILNAMEKKAKSILDSRDEYREKGRRGMLIVEIRDEKDPDQWDSTCRSFGTVFRDYQYDEGLVTSNGTNFDALAHGKVAFSRRTGFDSGTNYYQVLGYESYWKGAVVSEDGKCICAFAGFQQGEDREIAEAGITCYGSLVRTGKSIVTGGDPEHEIDPTKGGAPEKPGKKGKAAAKEVPADSAPPDESAPGENAEKKAAEKEKNRENG
jgi:hypothetical protein